jgi:predicted GNAT superfamily acetyltransferase
MSARIHRSDSVSARAARTAEAVAHLGGVRVRALETIADVKEAADLLASVWHTAPTMPPINADLMRALAHTGNYVAGAYVGDRLVGVSVAFLTGNGAQHLHSHVSGVAPAVQGHSVGYALKLHQRAWALQHDISVISWTVDPLVRRNMFFNLVKLRAAVVGYLPNFYGAMSDGVNSGDDSDRLMLSWQLADPQVDEPSPDVNGAQIGHDVPVLVDVLTDGGPELRDSVSGSALFACRLPVDIVELRMRRPELAAAWRRIVRATVGAALHDGARVTGFSREGGYIVAR